MIGLACKIKTMKPKEEQMAGWVSAIVTLLALGGSAIWQLSEIDGRVDRIDAQ